MTVPFWQRKRLAEMTDAEWESLCDRCGRCCLVKLEDPMSGRIDDTDVACQLFDEGTCSCRDYANRQRQVPDCVKLTAEVAGTLAWMPRTCAYRLLAEGRPLYWWHPLVSGDSETVHLAGISVRHRVIDERRVPDDELEDHIIVWPLPDDLIEE